MKKKQYGVSLSGLLMVAFVLALLALLGMKVLPHVIEYFNIVKAVKKVSSAGESVAEIKKHYESQMTVDDTSSVGPGDLEISKDSGTVVVSFAYEKRIPLFENVSLLIDFQGSSKK